MFILEYPPEVQSWIDAFKPYYKNCSLVDAPPEAVEAFEKFKKWFSMQGL